MPELEAYAKLKPLDPATDPKHQVDNSAWIFDLHPAGPHEVAEFKRNCVPVSTTMPDDPSFYVTTMWATPLMLMPGSSCWPRQFLINKSTMEDPASSLIFLRLVQMFGTQWDQTLAAGKIPTGDPIIQRRPGAVHLADVILLRIMQRALKQTGLEMNVISDPMIALNVMPGAQQNRPKKLSVCANEKCLRLKIQTLKCSKCKVSKTFDGVISSSMTLMRTFGQVAYYCGASCQKADWHAGHRDECKQLQEAHDKLPWKKQFDKDFARAKAEKRMGSPS